MQTGLIRERGGRTLPTVALRRMIFLASISISMLVSACSGTPTPQPSPIGLSPSSGPSASPSPTGPPEITLAFGGDVHFAERTLSLLDNPATAFGPVSSMFTAADVAMVNLETAVTTRGTPEPKQFHFRAPPAAFDAVKAAGLDVVSLANNHTLDYGQVGLADTLAAASSRSVPVVGAGRERRGGVCAVDHHGEGGAHRVPRVHPDHRARVDLGCDRHPTRASHGDQWRSDRAGRVRPYGPPRRRPTSSWCTCTGGRSTTSARSSCSARPLLLSPTPAPRSSWVRTHT